MAIRNETLRKKLESKRDFFTNKIAPLQEELDLTLAMLKQLDDFENKAVQDAEEKLGLSKQEAA